MQYPAARRERRGRPEVTHHPGKQHEPPRARIVRLLDAIHLLPLPLPRRVDELRVVRPRVVRVVHRGVLVAVAVAVVVVA